MVETDFPKAVDSRQWGIFNGFRVSNSMIQLKIQAIKQRECRICMTCTPEMFFFLAVGTYDFGMECFLQHDMEFVSQKVSFFSCNGTMKFMQFDWEVFRIFWQGSVSSCRKI